MTPPHATRTVVYLIGAGASHGSVKYQRCPYGILMNDLSPTLAAKIRARVTAEDSPYSSLKRLVNDIVTETTDYEHLITFLDESPSALHRQLAEDLRHVFEEVLRDRLSLIREDIGDARFSLYAALLDMYNVRGWPEKLQGILTLNYDNYIESAAASVYNTPVDLGVTGPATSTSNSGVAVLKLHGSFRWKDTWPILPSAHGETVSPLWIPPGIQKAKDRYPFNILWGRARELLNCDILRIIGCQLSGSDWDLISLLFTTRHTNVSRPVPYTIEIIDKLAVAQQMQKAFPYLGIRSLVEIEEMDIGQRMVAELVGGSPRSVDLLSEADKATLKDEGTKSRNWFRIWLQQMAESVFLEADSIQTDSGTFRKFMEDM